MADNVTPVPSVAPVFPVGGAKTDLSAPGPAQAYNDPQGGFQPQPIGQAPTPPHVIDSNILQQDLNKIAEIGQEPGQTSVQIASRQAAIDTSNATIYVGPYAPQSVPRVSDGFTPADRALLERVALKLGLL